MSIYCVFVYLDELVPTPKAQPRLNVIIAVQVLLSVFTALLAVKGRLHDADPSVGRGL